ncbi:MAG: cytochrome P450 [Methylocystaceae bacterium]|nr:MAG: cytochrome P450 [Methylocystaceae bacterium]
MFRDPDFTPFQPAERPSYATAVRNYLQNWPPASYREGFSTLPGVWKSSAPTVFLTDPELIQEVLVDRAEHFTRARISARAFSALMDPASLFLAEGADWRWQRRAAAPAFRHETLLALVPIFAECAEAQAREWRSAAGGEAVDVHEAMTRTTLAVICQAVLGDPAALDREAFLASLTAAFGGFSWQALIAAFGLPRWTPHPGYFEMRAAVARLNAEAAKVIAARRAAGSTRRDVLGLLLSARDPETGRVMTDRELASNLFTFIAAGHETAAIGLAWTLWLLAKDQATQERVREEVVRIAGARDIGPEDVDALVFTRQVVQESLRLFPPAPTVTRQAKEDTRIGPHPISRKSSVFVAIWSLHRNERLWDEPAAFDPDRFAPEKAKARHRFAYLPFGGGPRVCIGMSFAMLEITTILATLARDFRFTTVPGFRPEVAPNITLRPKGGLPLRVERISAGGRDAAPRDQAGATTIH